MNFLYYIGIDMSKEWFDAAIRFANNPKVTKHQRFENTEKGFKQFIRWCKEKGITDLSALFICLEHTGVYAIPFCEFIAKQQITYTLVPGAVTANQGISRGKSDKLDAKRIASYAYKNREDIRIHTLANEAIRILKTLLAFRIRVIKAKHGISVSYKEIKSFETQNVVASILDGSEQMIQQFNAQLKQIDGQIKQVLEQEPELKRNYELLLSVPGIGPQNALYMIVFTKNFVSFICPKKFAAYSGIAPFSSSSGKSIQSRNRVSHKANKKMKTLLTNAVTCSLNTCAEYRQYFDKQLKRGKNENSIKNVLRNKIVTRAFAVIKRNSPYVNTHAFMG